MTATWTADGKSMVLNDLASTTSRDWTLLEVGLGTESPSGEAVVLSDLGEVSLAGYARQAFADAGWGSGSSSDTVTLNASPGVTFDFDPYGGSPVTVFNMFVIDPDDDLILYYEVIPARGIDQAGDSLTLELTIGDNTLPLP